MSSEALRAVCQVLDEHRVMALSTCGEAPHAPADADATVPGAPAATGLGGAAERCASAYAAPVYYARSECDLVFLSDPETRHGRHLARRRAAAAAVFNEPERFDVVRGVQVAGVVERLAGDERRRLLEIYLERFSAAAPLLEARPATALYRLRFSWAKLTDNSRGFGFHLVWQEPEHDACECS